MNENLMPIDPLTDCAVTETSLTASADIPIEKWLAQVEKLKSLKAWANSTVNFWLGDLIIFGKNKFGEMYSQALDATDKEYQTLKDIVWVCEAVPPDNRMGYPLTFSHHKCVARLSIRDQKNFLKRAKAEALSVRQFREVVDEERPNRDKIEKPMSFSAMKADEILRLCKSSKSFYREVYIDPQAEFVESLKGNGKVITEIALLAKAILVSEGYGRRA